MVKIDAEILKYLAVQAFLIPENSQEDMFGSEIFVLVFFGLFPGQNNRAPRLVCKTFKHAKLL